MNLGVIEAALLPAVQRAVAARAVARPGPPVHSAVTGMKFDLWVHAARFEDLGGVTTDGAVTARRPVRLRSNLRGFAEERPARIVVELTCTGPTAPGVQAVCGTLPPAVMLALETMPHPVLSALPNDNVVLRFADFAGVLHATTLSHRVTDDAAYFVGAVIFHLDGFLHMTVAQRGGVTRQPAIAPRALQGLTLRVVVGSGGEGATGEHVVITNAGAEAVPLGGFVLHDAAPRRPHRFVLPAFTLQPGASVRVWTRKGRNDAENLYWGRVKPVWNDRGDAATLLDPTGLRVGHASDPERPAG